MDRVELVLKFWTRGIQHIDNYDEEIYNQGELDMALERAKILEKRGMKPMLYSRTWNGKFEALFGSFYKEPKRKVMRKRNVA